MRIQHDGASVHYGSEVRACLDFTYPQRWIGRRICLSSAGQLFGKQKLDDDFITRNNNFQTFGNALMVLFRSAT
ncbi:hypothetical protein EVAR_73455_1, partial [Eumeta japonica]